MGYNHFRCMSGSRGDDGEVTDEERLMQRKQREVVMVGQEERGKVKRRVEGWRQRRVIVSRGRGLDEQDGGIDGPERERNWVYLDEASQVQVSKRAFWGGRFGGELG